MVLNTKSSALSPFDRAYATSCSSPHPHLTLFMRYETFVAWKFGNGTRCWHSCSRRLVGSHVIYLVALLSMTLLTLKAASAIWNFLNHIPQKI